MPHPSQTDAARIQADAEQVRSWLVTVRGGAPFLSPADGRLLLDWLQDGVPVAAIIAAIDTVAERRRKQRARRRLSLRDCRKLVEQGRTTPAVGGPEHFEPPRAAATERSGLAALADEIAATAVPDALHGQRDRLAERLRDLATRDAHVDELGRAAAAAVQAFHDAAWDAAGDEHHALRTQAEARLAPMKAVLPARDYQGLVDEVARDLLRQRTPAVSAKRAWDTLAG